MKEMFRINFQAYYSTPQTTKTLFTMSLHCIFEEELQ